MSDRMSIDRAAEQIRHRYGPALEVLENEEVEFVAIHPADTDAGRSQDYRLRRRLQDALENWGIGNGGALVSFDDIETAQLLGELSGAAIDALKESS